MTRIVEDRHVGEPWLLWWLGNASALNSVIVRSIGIAWLFKEAGSWRFMPRIAGNASLYYNAVFFLRLAVPFGLFWSVRWSAETDAKALWQAGLGWKLNGRLALLCRVQSDASSAVGVTGPNLGQASGFEFGTH